MKNSQFTESGYPTGNKLLRDYMKQMLEIGEKHDSIKKFNKSIRSLEKTLQNKKRQAISSQS